MPTKFEVVVRPHITEKTSAAYQDRTEYTFEVHPDATKQQIRLAIEELFGVKVVRVNVSMVQPKPKRRGAHRGTKPGWKKAIVQLQPGDSIEIFTGAQV